MPFGGQQQEAGDHSQQFQISGDNHIHQGLDVVTAHALFREIAKDEIQRYTEQAQQVAELRMAALEERLIHRLGESGGLSGLADPAAQVALRKAQMGAASTERLDDYDMLAGLIQDHIEKGENRLVRAGVERAIEVVDKLDSLALRGLTLHHVATSILPLSGHPRQGLTTMERVISSIVQGGELPRGTSWVEHLDILDVARIHRSQEFKTFDDFWCGCTPGYVSPGIDIDSYESLDVIENPEIAQLAAAGLVRPHIYKPGFLYIAAPAEHLLQEELRKRGHSDDVEALVVAARTFFHFGSIEEDASRKYMEEVRARPGLKRLADFWESYEINFTLTIVGQVLSRSNARRLNVDLPPLAGA